MPPNLRLKKRFFPKVGNLLFGESIFLRQGKSRQSASDYRPVTLDVGRCFRNCARIYLRETIITNTEKRCDHGGHTVFLPLDGRNSSVCACFADVTDKRNLLSRGSTGRKTPRKSALPEGGGRIRGKRDRLKAGSLRSHPNSHR